MYLSKQNTEEKGQVNEKATTHTGPLMTFGESMVMELHIGKEIEKRFLESGIKPGEFARRINTGQRNIYAIFRRKDINTDLLFRIGKALNFNFFTLYFSAAAIPPAASAQTESLVELIAGFRSDIKALLQEKESYRIELENCQAELRQKSAPKS